MSEGTRNRPVYQNTNPTELRAFLGVLIMTGVRHDGHLNLKMMFDVQFGALFYRSIFSLKRFEWLLRTLRFDNRDHRNPNDRFSPIREIFDMFINNCKKLYVPGPIVTVDEMLAPFRGKVPFRMYIPSKPAKYGMKLFMVNDAKSQYCYNAIPYLGKNSYQEREKPADVNQGEFYTMQLLNDLLIAGRTVVLDNWFTSLPLTRKLQRYDMHLVGTIRMNKAFLPSKDFIKSLKLPKNDAVALYNHDEKMNLVVKKVKSSKYVGILSTLHNNLTVVEGTKTEAHMFYNAGKGGTDAFDQRCAVTSCSRKTNRWPLAMFFQLLNIAMNNAYILYSESEVYDPVRYNEKAQYLNDVAYRMCRPWALEKYSQLDPRQENNKVMLRMAFRIIDRDLRVPPRAPQPEEAPAPPVPQAPLVADAAPDAEEPPRFSRDVPVHQVGKIPYLGGRNTLSGRQRCHFCDTKSGWRGKMMCETDGCGKSVCPHHSVILCQVCYHGNR